MKMNKQLLLKVAALITREPRKLDMEIIVSHNMRGRDNPPPCGTIGCIAGWTAHLKQRNPASALVNAPGLLGLSWPQASRLFFLESWPVKFRHAYSDALTAKQRARVTVARIKHFIRTKGRQ